MKYIDFITFINSIAHQPVILLEGKRNVLDGDEEIMEQVAVKLAADLPNVLFRSGNASGADAAFSKGIYQIDPSRMENILPRPANRKSYLHEESRNISLQELNEPELNYLISESKKYSPKYERMINYYQENPTITDRLAESAKYILRDSLKVMGSQSDGIAKADIGLFYIDQRNKYSGGTGHTIQVCEALGIPVLTQEIWKHWLYE